MIDPNRLTPDLKDTLNRMEEFKDSSHHEMFIPEHLLYALLEDAHARTALQLAGVQLDVLEERVLDMLGSKFEELRFRDPDEKIGDDAINSILKRPFDIYNAFGDEGQFHVDGLDMLHSILLEECDARNILEEFMDVEDLQEVMSYMEKKGLRWNISMALGPDGTVAANHGAQPYVDYEAADMTGHTRTDVAVRPLPELGENLQNYCKNLNEKAQSGTIDPLIGREDEVERAIQIFSRRRKNNPLLVGDPGVGKTAIAEGLARRIVEGNVPDIMKNDIILELDMGAVLAGTRYRGDFEERIKGVVSEVEEFEAEVKKNYPEGTRAPRIRLFIDEIHTVIGAGATSGGAMDASNLIKPALASGALSCMGATTYKEFRQHFEKDAALGRRFQKIDVAEPTVAQTQEILKGLKGYFEDHHGVKYTDEALEKAASLAERYIHDRQLPDSAIDVIDEAGALQRARNEGDRKAVIDVAEVEETLAKIARIPAKTVSGDDLSKLANLEMDLKGVVFGQDGAIEALSSAVKLARAGLREPEKPIGSYLFAGPTGVGKTEVSKQLAETLGIEFKRFDMSEYMEKHSVSRLIGAPPGYVGFDQGGMLTDAIDQHPHCVLLLDEIEKAHPDVYNILLQVMDNGKLTDHNGKEVDFRNVILIMTSNAGAAEQAKPAMGFGRDKREGEETAAVERAFSPEFRNRLDAVVSFSSLPESVMENIVEKFIKQVQNQLADRGVELVLEDSAKSWLAKEGYDDRMGARPLGRVIQEYVKKPLSEVILFGDLKDGGKVTISFNEASKTDADAPKLAMTFNARSAKAEDDEPKLLEGPSVKPPRLN